jgi:bacterioferritin (cytochrome b1)
MDKQKVIKKLNAALEREFTEVVRYMHQSFSIKGKDAAKLKAFFREQSAESMEHATKLGQAVVKLGGKPVVRILEIYEPSAKSARAMLLECVQHEQDACDGYLKMLPLVDGDPELRRLVAGLAREEGEHIAGIRKLAAKVKG